VYIDSSARFAQSTALKGCKNRHKSATCKQDSKAYTAPEICKKHNFQDLTPFDAPEQYRSTPFSPSQKKKKKEKRKGTFP
jgi:hypothetical protein